MADQEHLSAEYMQGKAVHLLSRCGDMTARLQALMRLCGTVMMQDELHVRASELIEADALPAHANVLKTRVSVELQSKADPDIVRTSAEELAPAAALNQLDHVLRESALLHESIMAQERARQQQQYESALRRAGLLVQAGGKLVKGMKPPLDDDEPPPPSIVDALLAPTDPADSLDDLTALQLALHHLESIAPASWNLSSRLLRAAHSHARSDLLLAELGDRWEEARERWERMQQRQAKIALELEEDSKSTGESPAQQIRRRLDQLRKTAAEKKTDSLTDQAKATLRKMEADAAEARKIMEEYRRAEKLMQARGKKHKGEQKNGAGGGGQGMSGVDLESIMQGDGFTGANGGSFLLLDSASSSATPAFPVQFALDGSGRLRPVGREALTASEVLGFGSMSEADRLALMNAHSSTELVFASPEERLHWCRSQLLWIDRRMEARFGMLTKHLDHWAVERVSRRREDAEIERAIEDRVASLSSYVRDAFGPQVESFREGIQRQVDAIARESRAWEEKNRYYERVHRESMVLLQRMGEEVETIVQ